MLESKGLAYLGDDGARLAALAFLSFNPLSFSAFLRPRLLLIRGRVAGFGWVTGLTGCVMPFSVTGVVITRKQETRDISPTHHRGLSRVDNDVPGDSQSLETPISHRGSQAPIV